MSTPTMRNETVEGFLRALAAWVPAPDGGATAALYAAQAAALVAMVARHSDGLCYAEHAEEITHVRDTADVLGERALDLAERDAEAFTAVTDAYRCPRGTEGEAEQRSRAIAEAVLGASRPPADVVTTAGSVLDLAERLLPLVNRNVVSDVAAATTARVNIDINLGGIVDADARDELREACRLVDELAARAEKLTAAVRAELTR